MYYYFLAGGAILFCLKCIISFYFLHKSIIIYMSDKKLNIQLPFCRQHSSTGQYNKLCISNLDGTALAVAIADENRPTATAALTLEPDADGEFKEVIILEIWNPDFRWNTEAAAVSI